MGNAGIMVLRLCSADLHGLFDDMLKAGLCLKNTQVLSELEAEITVTGKEYPIVEKICEKRGDTVKVLRKKGLTWRLQGLHRRPVLIAAVIFYLLSALMIPSRVFFVRVVGNTSVPDQKILEAADGCGIGFGASRRAVRSEKMKNALLEAMPELQWAGVNTYGCVAEISVRERSREEEKAESSQLGHIVAVTDGIILSCHANRGNLLCAPGQAVAAGDILISAFTDCGLAIRTEQADGEIFAATRRRLTAVAPAKAFSAADFTGEMKKISLLIGKKRINLWKDSGFWDATCDRMYEENYITLPGGFQLPVGWCIERSRIREISIVETDPRELLQNCAEQYLKDSFVALTIRHSDCSYEEIDGMIYMTGEYGCVEMIGAMQRLEIGEIHGKDN